MSDAVRPEERLEDRVTQLRHALPIEGSAEGGWGAFVASITVGVWQAVGQGDLDAPRRVLAELDGVAGWAEDHLPAPGTAVEEAAREVDRLHRWLTAAVDGLALPAAEVRLRREGVERAVLEVLHARRDRALTRGEVHKALPKAQRPSAARISQVLEALADEGLVVRAYGRARGGENVAHYRLWSAGAALCARVGIGRPEAPERREGAVEAPEDVVFGAKARGYAESLPPALAGWM